MSDDRTQAYRKLLGQRIDEVVGCFPTKSAAAAAAGVTVEQLNKWIKGTVKVPTDGLYGLAAGGGVDFRWLAAGEGSQQQEAHSVTKAVFEGIKIINAVMMEIYRDEGVKIPPSRVVEEVTDHSKALIAKMDDLSDLEELQSLIPWLENRIRKSLRQPGTGKRSAS